MTSPTPGIGIIEQARARALSDKWAFGISDEKLLLELAAALEQARDALAEWKCPSCGGKGTYQQNAVGRARDEARGRQPDPKFAPDPVMCRVCNGHGLHPKAHAVLRTLSPVPGERSRDGEKE